MNYKYINITERGKVVNVWETTSDHDYATETCILDDGTYEPLTYRDLDKDLWVPINILVITTSDLDSDDPNDIIEHDASGNKITCKVDSTIGYTFTLSDLTVSATARIPFYTSNETRYTLANFVDGVASFSVPVNKSGLWRIDTKEVNNQLVDTQYIMKDDLSFYVVV